MPRISGKRTERKGLEPYVNATFKADPKDWSVLQMICIHKNITLNDFLNQIVKEAIKKNLGDLKSSLS